MEGAGIPSDHIENCWSIGHYLSKNKIPIVLIHGGFEVHSVPGAGCTLINWLLICLNHHYEVNK